MKEDLKTLLKVAKMINYKKYNELYASIDLVVYDKKDIENSQINEIILKIDDVCAFKLLAVLREFLHEEITEKDFKQLNLFKDGNNNSNSEKV